MQEITLKNTVTGESYCFQGRVVGYAFENRLYESDSGKFYREQKIDQDVIVFVYEDEPELEYLLLRDPIEELDNQITPEEVYNNNWTIIKNGMLIDSQGRFPDLVKKYNSELIKANSEVVQA